MAIQFINRLFSAVCALLILHTMSLFTWRAIEHVRQGRLVCNRYTGASLHRDFLYTLKRTGHALYWAPLLLWLCLQGNLFTRVKGNKNRQKGKIMDQNKPRVRFEVSIVSPLSMILLIDQYPIYPHWAPLLLWLCWRGNIFPRFSLG